MEETANPSFYSLTLKSSEEARLEQVFSSHCTSHQKMSLYDFLILSIEKRIVSNNCPLNKICLIFQQAASEKENLNKSRFFFAITLLARELYPNELAPVEPMLTQILVDPMAGSSQSNLPRQDEITKQLFTESIVKRLENYHKGILKILEVYNTLNIQNRRKTIGIEEIKNKNLGITVRNFLRYCRISLLIPHLINIETFIDCVKAFAPPADKDEKSFYDSSILIKNYETETNFLDVLPLEPVAGEPELKMYNIEFILSRIAFESNKDVTEPLQKVLILFDEKLKLNAEHRYGPGCNIVYGEEPVDDQSYSSAEEEEKIIADYEHKLIVAGKNLRDDKDLLDVIRIKPVIPTFDEIEKMMDDDRVPQVPPRQEVVQQNPPPYALPPTLFALPVPPDPKNVKPALPPKPKGGKKEETAADRLKFAPLPGSYVKKLPEVSRSQKFLPLRNESNLYPETLARSLCNPGIGPCLIKEIFSPPFSPPEVTTLIESVLSFQNNGVYSKALEKLDEAKKRWLEIERTTFLKTEIELFFELTRGAIYESCEKDPLALGQYYGTKLVSDKLPFNHPDRALVYSGMGSVLHHLGMPDLSLRCYLMARKIRERTLGGDTVDTASSYNNIAVCFNELGRFQESMVYFELSEAILDTLLGPNHPRTLTVRQNIERVKRQAVLTFPEYQVLWSKQMVDPFPKGGKKKKSKKGKKGKK